MKKICVTPQGIPNVPKLCASGGIDFSKCIEGGSMKLTTLVEYIICLQSRMHYPCNECRFFKLFIIILFLNLFICDLVKAKPIRDCIELPI